MLTESDATGFVGSFALSSKGGAGGRVVLEPRVVAGADVVPWTPKRRQGQRQDRPHESREDKL